MILKRYIAAFGIATILVSLTPGAVYADDLIEARRHFQVGMGLIQEKQYGEGIEELEKAYELRPHPAVLYNIGRAYLEAEKLESAIAFFHRYLDTEPEDRQSVQALIEELRARQEQKVRQQGVAAARPKAQTGGAQAQRGGAQAQAAPPPGELSEMLEQIRRITLRIEQLSAGAAPATEGGAAAREGASMARAGASGTATESGASTEMANVGGRNAGESQSAEPVSEGEGGKSRAPSERIAVSEDAAEDPYAPVVITSSRYSQSPLEAPNAITVLSGDQLMLSGVRTLPELLRQVPGLEVMAISPGDYNVGIRGFNAILSNKVLILVDGRSVYLDFVGANIWPLLSISPSDVERIEIIRGPGAALYGANAFSGVINIITKTPGDPSDQSILTLRGGRPDWTDGSLHLSGRENGTSYRATVGFEQADRWSTEIDPNRADYIVNPTYKEQATHLKRFDARVDRRLSSETTVSLSGGLTDGQVEFAAIGALRDYFVDGEYGYLRGDLGMPNGVSLRAFWNHFNALASPWATPTGSYDMSSRPISDVVDVEGEWFSEFELGIRHRLNLGLGYRYKTISWEWLGSQPIEHHAALFLQDEFRIAESLSGVLSLRLDRHPVLADRTDASFLDRYPFSPRLAFVWKINSGQSLRTTLGTAFRTPTFLENYNLQPIPTENDAVMVLNVGNKELLPERILSAEVGYLNQPATSRYQFESSVFINKINNLVQLSAVEPWSDPSTAYNSAEGFYYAGTSSYVNSEESYLALGTELGGKWFPVDGLDIYTNYTFTYIRRGVGEEAARLKSTSPHKLSAGLQIKTRGGLLVGGDVHLVSEQTWQLRSFDEQGQAVISNTTLPAYSRAGVRLGYRSWDGRLETTLVANNILAFFRNQEDGANGATPTPAFTHREHPLGQAIPADISLATAFRF